jgi:diguanylate cyclase (GGDEF)-like protein
MDGQTYAAHMRADDAVERAISELEALLAERAGEPRAREALETLRHAWSSARVDAQTDPLTELPNRAWLRQALEDTIARCARTGAHAALLFLDLDGFKEVNDRHGHQAGDLLLAAVAKRVLSSVRDEDLVARHGGDEFVVLLENLESPQVAYGIAGRVVDAVSTNYAVDGDTFRLSVSVGVALYPQHGSTGGELLRNADLAMYRAKNMGGRRYEICSNNGTREPQSGLTRAPFASERPPAERDPQAKAQSSGS